MHAEDLAVDDGGDGHHVKYLKFWCKLANSAHRFSYQQVEYLVHSLPDLLAQLLAKLADALLVEGEVELDLAALVVALNNGNAKQ